MKLGYHTAGLLLHDEPTSIVELARMGYRCVAIRPRRGVFNPLEPDFEIQAARVATTLAHTEMDVVLDADSRFIHDPYHSDPPSLVSGDHAERLAAVRWIERLIEVADHIGGSVVTFAAGHRDAAGGGREGDLLDRLAEELNRLLEFASRYGVRLALHPATRTPIGNVASFERLQQWLRSPGELRLAADVGEMIASSELPLGERLARNAGSLDCVYLCDVLSVSPGDQRIGWGDVNLPRILEALREQSFTGRAIVRVEGHASLGLVAAKEAWEQLHGKL